MSFFERIFGGGEKKPQPKPVQRKVDTALQQKIDQEKALNTLQKKIDEYDDNQKKLQAKFEILMAKAKQLVKAEKKNEAKKYTSECQRIRKQIQALLIHKKTLLDNQTQLEDAGMKAQITRILQQTNLQIKKYQQDRDRLLDLIQQTNIRKVEQKEYQERIKALVLNDSEQQAAEELLDQIVGEVQKERKKQSKKIQAKEVHIKVTQQKFRPVQQKDQIQQILSGL